jgi:hypothetical protein
VTKTVRCHAIRCHYVGIAAFQIRFNSDRLDRYKFLRVEFFIPDARISQRCMTTLVPIPHAPTSFYYLNTLVIVGSHEASWHRPPEPASYGMCR